VGHPANSLRAIIGQLIALIVGVLIVEAATQIVYRLRSPQHLWIAQAARLQPPLFRPHPFLAAAGVPNVHAEFGNTSVTHNPHGYRGPDRITPKDPRRVRIAVLGGSSTYGVLVSDADTWPAQLASELGPSVEVLNLGIPGYTTVENLMQTAFEFGDLAPDIALYYLGWNDLRNTHVANLDAYYAAFHGASQPLNLTLDEPGPGRIATWYYLRKAWGRAYERLTAPVPVADRDADTDKPDARAQALFAHNVEMIIALAAQQHVTPVFIPQVLNCAALSSETPYGWVPFVRDRDLCAVNTQYAGVLERTAAANHAAVLDGVLRPGLLGAADFADQGHFTPTGAKRFAAEVARELTARGVVATRP
jgi:hypothetical protein